MATLEDAEDAARDRADELLDAVDRRLPAPVDGVVRRISNRDVLLQASSLAFYGLISTLPLLVIAFAVVGAASGDGTLERFSSSLSRSGPSGVGRIVDQLVSSSRSLSWVTLLLAIWPATAYGGGLRRALQHASGEEPQLAGVHGRLLGLGLVLALPLLMLGGVPLVFVVTNLSGDGALATVLGWLLGLLAALLVGTATTAVLYRTFAPTELGWGAAVRGAAPVSFATAAFSLGFVAYLNLGDIEQRFGGGTSALVVLLGLWLFVANVLLVAGYHAVVAIDGDGS